MNVDHCEAALVGANFRSKNLAAAIVNAVSSFAINASLIDTECPKITTAAVNIVDNTRDEIRKAVRINPAKLLDEVLHSFWNQFCVIDNPK